MFAYCGNNPISRIDSAGTIFFTVLGAAIGAISGAIDAAIMGGSAEEIKRGALAGAASGAIAGAGVDIGTAITVATGGAGVAAGVAVAGVLGAAGAVVGTGITNKWEGDPLEYVSAGLVGGLTNMISFGLAPINGEIAKGSLTCIFKGLINEGVKDFGMNVATGTVVATGATWITRVVNGKEQRVRMPLLRED